MVEDISSLKKNSNDIHDNFCVTKSKHVMHNIQAYNVLYNNGPVTCEGWHFTQMWRTLAWPQYVTIWRGLGHEPSHDISLVL